MEVHALPNDTRCYIVWAFVRNLLSFFRVHLHLCDFENVSRREKASQIQSWKGLTMCKILQVMISKGRIQLNKE